MDEHTPLSERSRGNSTFLRSLSREDIRQLILDAAATVPMRQPNGNYARIVNAGRTIGVDVVTKLYTDIYTVITDAATNLVTAHPGHPR